MSVVLHTTYERYSLLKRQGWRLDVRPTVATTWPGIITDDYGDVVFHRQGEDHVWCNLCGREVDSVIASTPAEMEAVISGAQTN